MKNVREVVRDNSAMSNKLLEILVNKAHKTKPIDQPRQRYLKNAPLGKERLPPIQAEVKLTRPRIINLEKTYSEPSTILAEFGRITETAPVDMVEVQKLNNSALNKGPKIPKIYSSISSLCRKVLISLRIQDPRFQSIRWGIVVILIRTCGQIHCPM
ncbi:hypothetical protein COP1_047095 [Malus domestica]